MKRRFKHRIQVQNINTVTQQGAVNDYGDVDDTAQDYWDTGPLVRCFIAPIGSTEDETDRETLSHQYDIYLDIDVDIQGTSQVILFADTDDAVTGRVLGEPQKWPSAMRGYSHQVVRVETIRG